MSVQLPANRESLESDQSTGSASLTEEAYAVASQQAGVREPLAESKGILQ